MIPRSTRQHTRRLVLVLLKSEESLDNAVCRESLNCMLSEVKCKFQGLLSLTLGISARGRCRKSGEACKVKFYGDFSDFFVSPSQRPLLTYIYPQPRSTFFVPSSTFQHILTLYGTMAAGTIDIDKPGKYPIVLSDALLGGKAAKDVYTGIRCTWPPSPCIHGQS
jgi:hypothetical protein